MGEEKDILICKDVRQSGDTFLRLGKGSCSREPVKDHKNLLVGHFCNGDTDGLVTSPLVKVSVSLLKTDLL